MEAWRELAASILFFGLITLGWTIHNHERCNPIPGQRWEVTGIVDVFVKGNTHTRRPGIL